MSKNAIPLISIVGRPNVGKSTLFNRLMGRRLSIVDDMPGVTRDRIFGRRRINGIPCHLVDTGGLTSDPGKDAMETAVEKQILMSIDSSAALIFVTDASAGLLPEDEYIADILRRKNKPVIIAVNKAESPKLAEVAHEFHSLGLGDPSPISAQHGINMEVLLARVEEYLPKVQLEKIEERRIKFCVVGRPNVGKSSIVNCLLGEERCVVSPIAGTTRDRVDVDFMFDDQPFVIVDTAGMKRKKSSMDNLEFYSFTRARKAIEDSDVAVLVLDAQFGLLEGDKKIASLVVEKGKGLIVAANKMDMIEKPDYDMFLKNLFHEAPFLRHTPVVFISALKKRGMDSMLDSITDISRRLRELMPIDLLKNLVYDTRALYSPRAKGRRVGEIKDVIHDRANPPRVIIMVNDTELFPPEYVRLFENRIRSVFNLSGVPLDLFLSEQKKKKKS